MKVKKAFKIFGAILLGLMLILSALLAYWYYNYHGKYNISSEYYYQVGHIDLQHATQVNDNFSLCGNGSLVGYYHSAAPEIYKGSKYQFRNFITTNFNKVLSQESGYLNVRFHINCHGQVGNLEINELDENLTQSDLPDEFVDQIIPLIATSENWSPFAGAEYNYYMYLNFKIENGEIVEILP